MESTATQQLFERSTDKLPAWGDPKGSKVVSSAMKSLLALAWYTKEDLENLESRHAPPAKHLGQESGHE